MKFINCCYETHAAEILEILNQAIISSTALYDYKPRTIDTMANWFNEKSVNDFPVIAVLDANDKIMGFATYGTFRAWPAFKYSVEHSIYIHQEHQGKGLGKVLLTKIIEAAKQQQYHTIIGGIDITNTGSIALHEKLGFVHSGTIKEAGFKFGRWLDLGFYQLILHTPEHPVDG
ncbi:N-acetyltransferase family protein [Thalassotalea psychrophila]|uniref:N-acetyltransferase family protein n=1 Tax=Thalassotalea psychrophila TaxID=3065647 RepID=A0ABY9TT31_9GAMM|nr:N-acetyltransferase family protein [Colwelliaceae bacterium SQ149]